MFTLHPQLLQDTYYIGKLKLCRVLLMNNKLFPWVILVPEQNDITEIFELKERDQKILITEIAAISNAMKQLYWPDKINVAALGNQVPQLHVHIIARFKTDTAWPQPIWGQGLEPYDQASVTEVTAKLQEAFKEIKGFAALANAP